MTMIERYEKILHDGLVEDNLIGRKWRVRLNGVEDDDGECAKIRFDVYRYRGKNPVGTILTMVNLYRNTIDCSESGPFWEFWDQYRSDIIWENMQV